MKIYIHLHLFYTEMLDEMLFYLSNLSSNSQIEFDLCVTLCEHNKDVETKIYAFKDNAKILIVPNRGYDLAPFLFAIKQTDLSQYDYLIKLHSKRDLKQPAYLPCCRLIGAQWRQKLLEFMATPQNLQKTLSRFDKKNKAGMLTAPELIVKAIKEDRQAISRAEQIIKDMGLHLKNKNFVAGTMFIARAHLFKPLQNLSYQANDFEEFDPTHKGGSLAHALERVLGFIIGAQGYDIISYHPFLGAYFLKSILYRLTNFIFYKRINSKGILHIKICKIPVYSKKI